METLFLLAHLSVSGVPFPSECCSGSDCYEIQSTDLNLIPGGWKIKATGEVFQERATRKSPDERYYRCSAQARTESRTYCLFIPSFGS